MVFKNKRKIKSRTAYTIPTWSHFRFWIFLLHKIKEYKYCKVIKCIKKYTSKTCEHCKQINDKLDSSKTFQYNSCKVKMDQDVNRIRNILLKLLMKGKALRFMHLHNFAFLHYNLHNISIAFLRQFLHFLHFSCDFKLYLPFKE